MNDESIYGDKARAWIEKFNRRFGGESPRGVRYVVSAPATSDQGSKLKSLFVVAFEFRRGAHFYRRTEMCYLPEFNRSLIAYILRSLRAERRRVIEDCED
jgi:hypothetical protein